MKRGRKPSIGYRQRGGGGYFFTENGKPIALAMGPDDGPHGPTYTAAFQKWCQIRQEGYSKGTDGYRVSSLYADYAMFLELEQRAASLNNVKHMVKVFADLNPNLVVRDIRPSHVREWLTHKRWGMNTKRLAYKLLAGMLNWGIKEGKIATNPIKGKMDLPKERVKGIEARLSPELCDLLISNAGPDFALYLRVLRATGARPEEITEATAAHLGDGYLVYPWRTQPGDYQHKQARKGKEVDRVINFPASLWPVIVELAKKHPTGPLFRTIRGKKWGNQNRNDSFDKLLNKHPIKSYLKAKGIESSTVVPYSFRSTFITEWVESGRSIAICAELVGNSASVNLRYYSRPDFTRMRTIYLDYMGEK